MAANTDLTRLNLVGRIALLAGQAVELTVKQNGRLRSIDMVQRLDRALQLYKNNQLGDVQIFVSEPEKRLVIDKRARELRAAFREKINRFGEEKVEKMFTKNLPGRIRNQIIGDHHGHHNGIPLRKLVALSEEEVVSGTGIGKVSLPYFVKALTQEGLSLGMSEGEVEECFGPERVRIVIFLHKFGQVDVGTGVEVVIEASDGKIYRSTSYANGIFFELPPGKCKILEPKMHSPNSEDGYERLWLDTRRQRESIDLTMAD